MVRPAFIGLSPVELKYYQFMVSLDKCSGGCSSGNALSTKNVFQVKRKTKLLSNMITNRNEAETLVKHILCDYKCQLNSTTCNSSQKME